MALAFETLAADLRVAGGGLRELAAVAGGVTARLADGREATLRAATVRVADPRAPPPAEGAPAPVLEVATSVTDLRLPPGTLAPFDDSIPEAHLAATLKAPLGRTGSLAERLVAWRDRGGVVEVTQLSGRLTPLRLEADGTVTVDAALQPLAAFSVRARGAGDAVERFRRAGLLDAGAARAAKLALGLLGDATGEVRTALTVQDRTVYLGRLAVGRLPRVAW